MTLLLALALLSSAEQTNSPSPEVATLTTSDGRPLEQYSHIGGVKHGPYQMWHSNGQVSLTGQYDHGVRTGAWKTFNSDGQLTFETPYHLGLIHGMEIQFGDGSGHQKGRRVVVEKIPHALGKRHGMAELYWHNGQLRAHGQYQNGRKEGKWNSYNSDGKHLGAVQYRCGSTEANPDPCPSSAVRFPSPSFIAPPLQAKPDGPLPPPNLEALREEFFRAWGEKAFRACVTAGMHEMSFKGKNRSCIDPKNLRKPTVGGVRG